MGSDNNLLTTISIQETYLENTTVYIQENVYDGFHWIKFTWKYDGFR